MDHPTGDYSINGRDPSKLWNPAKNCIKSLWLQASSNDEFVVLLYQNKILYTIKGSKGDELRNWNSIESKMEEAIMQGGNTCIFNAWQTAEQYFTDNSDFYFITDGVEDHDNNNLLNKDEQAHIDAICEKIDEFCNLGINGFYTNLKQTENDNINNQISRKIKSSCFKNLIAGNITPSSLSLDQKDLSNGKKVFNLVFKPIESGKLINGQTLGSEFVNHNGGLENADTYFKVSISGIRNNKINLTIEQIKPVPQSLLDQSNTCKLFLNITSLDNDVAIFPHMITIDVKYYYEKIAYLPSLELEGTSKYHPAFFISPLANMFSEYDFIAEHKPDTISFNLKKLSKDKFFNNEAIKKGSSYKLQLVPIREKDKNAKFTVLNNGELCDSNTINVVSTDENIFISIIFDESSADGTFRFNLIPIEPNKLDKINDCTNIEEASIPITIEFDKDYNPLELLLICLLCVILTYCLIRISYSHLRRGVTCGIDYVQNGNQEVLVRKRRANRIKISSKIKKQNWIDWLFNGKTIYNIAIVPDLKSDICFESARLKRTMRVRCQKNNDYIIDGSNMSKQILTANEDIEHIIADKNNIELLILIVL